jgi:hypothetical protein
VGRVLAVGLHSLSVQEDEKRDSLPVRFPSLAHEIQLVPFRRKYQGCCGGLLYEWAYWTWNPFGTGNGPWVDTLWTYFSEGPIGSIGNCPFNDGGVIL